MITEDIGLWVACTLLGLLMFYIVKKVDFSVNLRSRLLFAIPFLLVLWFISTTGFEISLTGIYVGALILLYCFFQKDRRKMYRILSVSLACMVITPAICLHYRDYRITHYADEFRFGLEQMKEHYVLTDYKQVDLDALYREYLPRFEAADDARSFSQAYAAWMEFSFAFFDGHVYTTAGRTTQQRRANQEAYWKSQVGLDYGFSLVTLSDGRIVFANVDETGDAYRLGIRNGLTVTAFDGTDIQTARKQAKQIDTFADLKNAAFYQSLMITASGDRQTELTFLNETGDEQTITVTGNADNYSRYQKTLDQLRGNNNATNLSYQMVSGDTALLYLNDMMVPDNITYKDMDTDSESYSGMKTLLQEQIQKMKAEGATKLIIDTRGNGGGYLEMVPVVASLFTDKELFVASNAAYNSQTGQYEAAQTVYTDAGNIWGDGAIVILVNSDTTSAAEIFVDTMMQLPNVTVMGFTKTCGAAMMASEIELTNVDLSFSAGVTLDENGEILIDSDASGMSKMTPDIIIPFDENAFHAIFENGEDYVLEYAASYLENRE